MDFKAVLEKLIGEFKKRKVRYALIGGFALGLRGVGRATIDLDILINKEDTSKVDEIMAAMGYEVRFRSENVSQYVSPLKLFGEVDFLHAFREASLMMLQRAEEKKIFGSVKIKVLRTEDLIGLKLQAIKNNPSRKESEIKDIASLISAAGSEIEWPLIQRYAEVLDMEEFLSKIRKKIE